jgi:hypothetical protein
MKNYSFSGKVNDEWFFDLYRRNNRVRLLISAYNPYRIMRNKTCHLSRYKSIRYFEAAKRTISKAFVGKMY